MGTIVAPDFGATDPRFRLRPVTEILSADPPSGLFVQPYAYELGITALVGPPGDGKTMLATNLTLATASGVPVHGIIPTQQGAVIYLDGEGSLPLRLSAAARAAGLVADTLPIFDVAGDMLDLFSLDSVAAFIHDVRAAEVRPVLVVLDVLSLFSTGDENGPDMNVVVRHLKQITGALRCAAIALMHPTKADPTVERGHTSVRGCADVMLSTKRVGDRVTVSTTKHRYGPAGDVVGTFRICEVPEIHRGACLRPAADVVDDQSLNERDTIAVGALAPTGATFSEWLAASDAAGLSKGQFTRALERLETTGRVTKNGSRYARS